MRRFFGLLLLALALPVRPSGFVTPAVQENLRSLLQSVPQWTNVRVRIESATGTFYDISEPALGLSFSGSRTGGSHYSFSGRADGQFLSLTADPSGAAPAEGYRFWGSAADLDVRRSGDGYYVSGWIDNKSVSFSLSRFGQKDFNIWGQGGLNLSTSHFNGQQTIINGSVDLSQCGKKELSLISMVVAVVSAP